MIAILIPVLLVLVALWAARSHTGHTFGRTVR
jgi:hypothetical protein